MIASFFMFSLFAASLFARSIALYQVHDVQCLRENPCPSPWTLVVFPLTQHSACPTPDSPNRRANRRDPGFGCVLGYLVPRLWRSIFGRRTPLPKPGRSVLTRDTSSRALIEAAPIYKMRLLTLRWSLADSPLANSVLFRIQHRFKQHQADCREHDIVNRQQLDPEHG